MAARTRTEPAAPTDPLPPSARARLTTLNEMAREIMAAHPDKPWGGTPEDWDRYRAAHGLPPAPGRAERAAAGTREKTEAA